MIKVEFRSLETVKGEPTEVYNGSITLTDARKVVFEPKNKKSFFNELLSTPVKFTEEDSGAQVTYNFKDDPEGWMRNACQMYRAYTFWASKPIENKA